jgi:hypothetical protein
MVHLFVATLGYWRLRPFRDEHQETGLEGGFRDRLSLPMQSKIMTSSPRSDHRSVPLADREDSFGSSAIGVSPGLPRRTPEGPATHLGNFQTRFWGEAIRRRHGGENAFLNEPAEAVVCNAKGYGGLRSDIVEARAVLLGRTRH